MLESDKLFEKLIDNLVGLVILEIIKKDANKSEDINKRHLFKDNPKHIN